MKKYNGYYKRSITLGRNTDGEPIKKVVYAKTKYELEEKVAEFKLHSGIITKDITVNDLCSIWFNIRMVNKSKSYIRGTNLYLNEIKAQIGPLIVTQVRMLHINMIVNKYLTSKRYNSAHKALQILKSLFEFALDNDYISKNPAKNVEFTRYAKQEKTPLSKEQQEAIFSSTHRYADFYKVLLLTGMRKGEIAALTWNDIDFDNNTISINKACDFTTNIPTIGPTKTRRNRVIPLLAQAREILESRAKQKHSIYVFSKNDGSILTDTSIRRRLESFISSVNFKFTLHQLRHTYCTNLYYAGITSKKAQQLMGHSTLAVTMEIYTHLDESREDNAASILNNFLSKEIIRR